jgi:CspA family cold shock protein
MPTGAVKWFNATKGFGFIQPDDGGKDVFVHITQVQRSGVPELTEGQRLEYDLETRRDGRTAATNLTVI